MAAGFGRRAAVLMLLVSARAFAQADTSVFYRALDAEGAGRMQQAATLYRQALSQPANRANALLGLERAYAELGRTDSLLPVVDSLVRATPRDPTVRGVQLRALVMLGRNDDARRAFGDWARATPGAPDAFREYARLLLQRGRAAEADTVLRMASGRVGNPASLAMEVAQSRAALGQWTASAVAWRGALAGWPDLDQAAAYALAPAPATVRDSLRAIFRQFPVDVGARRALAGLEVSWGSAAGAWSALRDLSPDSASAAAWMDFASRAEAVGEWSLARDALAATLRWRPDPEVAVRAATAALNSGDPAGALSLLPRSGLDSAHEVALVLPLRISALARGGNPAQAQALADRNAAALPTAVRASLAEAVAFGWVRSGNLERAHAALANAGADADSGSAAGWLALYEGRLKTARILLKRSTEASAQLAEALGVIVRVPADSAADVGRAFLLLARGDSAGAATAFVSIAGGYGAAGSAMLALVAQLDAARDDTAGAGAAWTRILAQFSDSPEAPAAELSLARQLRRGGNAAGAATHLEHLILTYPESALVPQARRELELARRAIPGGDRGGNPGAHVPRGTGSTDS